MTRLQQIHYRAKLWPDACKAQNWDVKDNAKRREITLETTGQDTTTGLKNKQVDRLFRHLKWLANPTDFDAAYAEANPEIADEEADRNRLITRITETAEKAGFQEAYIVATSQYKIRVHGVKEWRHLPNIELLNLSKTITKNAASKRHTASGDESARKPKKKRPARGVQDACKVYSKRPKSGLEDEELPYMPF